MASASADALLSSAVVRLRRRQLGGGSTLVARLVASVLRAYVEALAAGTERCSVGDVAAALSRAGSLLAAADSTALTIPHITSRGLRLLGEEAHKAGAAAVSAEARAAALAAALDAELRGAAPSSDGAAAVAVAGLPFSAAMAEGVLDGLAELLDELENTAAGLESFVGDVLCPGDAVLTVGHSRTATAFLLRAAALRSPLDVFVAEGGSARPGHACAVELAGAPAAASPRSVVLVPDAGVWALLSSGAVRKVLLAAAAVARDGSAVVAAGCLCVALAARQFGTPVVLCIAATKVAPDASAEELLRRATGASCTRDALAAVRAHPGEALAALSFASPAAAAPHTPSIAAAPLWDVLPAHLVSLVVTNAGAYAPAGVGRLADELYGRHQTV